MDEPNCLAYPNQCYVTLGKVYIEIIRELLGALKTKVKIDYKLPYYKAFNLVVMGEGFLPKLQVCMHWFPEAGINIGIKCLITTNDTTPPSTPLTINTSLTINTASLPPPPPLPPSKLPPPPLTLSPSPPPY
ncbi:hypothetical protein CR513_39645, partial [Mucuna pruriens]